MYEVLIDWHSNSHSAEYGDVEITLAKAFMSQIGEQPTYLKLPEDDDHAVPIQNFIELLRSSNDTELAFVS
jgi:hypothetical protein